MMRPLALLALLATPAHAAAPIGPPAATLAITVSALGLLSLDATFTRFTGTLTDDTDCDLALTAEVASLTMSDDQVRDDMLSPDLLDAARYPNFSYRGACHGDVIEGALTLHGITRPLSLTLHRTATDWDVTGAFSRADWGITGRPFLAGPTVRLHFSWHRGEGR